MVGATGFKLVALFDFATNTWYCDDDDGAGGDNVTRGWFETAVTLPYWFGDGVAGGCFVFETAVTLPYWFADGVAGGWFVFETTVTLPYWVDDGFDVIGFVGSSGSK